MVEPVTGLAIFAGSWLAKKLAKDWANAKKDEQLSAFNAASFENNIARDKCMALQEQARAGMGRVGIQRIEAKRRVRRISRRRRGMHPPCSRRMAGLAVDRRSHCWD